LLLTSKLLLPQAETELEDEFDVATKEFQTRQDLKVGLILGI
jgi:hypothetical protein